MYLSFGRLIVLSWLLWALYWWWSARGVKTAVREDNLRQMLAYRLPVLLGFALLFVESRSPRPEWPWQRFLPAADWLPMVGLVLVLLGLGFACWARLTLGRNWSATVQLKQDHELIENGPYRHVRHPIYTGMLLALLGTAVAIGEWRGLLSLALVGGGFWLKLRHEEHWMREQFGAAYGDYMRRVKALIPGVL